MKQILSSAGLLALGAVSLYALDPEMSRQATGRPFSISASVRGFYDDNIYTAPDKERKESFGYQISPSAHLNLPLPQTFIGLGYVYTLSHYENRSGDKFDQNHEFSGKLRHQFSPRHQIGVDDSFVLTSEPTIVDRFGIITSPTRVRTRSSVYQNRGAIEDNFQMTRQLTLSLGYNNSWYDYEADGPGSRSALLDRIEHTIRADLRYLFTPKLVGIVGYSFGLNNYTANEAIGSTTDSLGTTVIIKSQDRDSYSHYGYVGVDYDMTAKLRASARIGAQFTDYHELGQSSASPYAEATLSYLFAPGTSGEVGVRHARNATDVVAVDTKTGRPTLDAETTAIFAQLQHRFTHDLTATFIGQFQTSTFQDGLNNGATEDLWLVGVNLNYSINRHLSAEFGYNYDQLNSDTQASKAAPHRSYDRNRVYVGLRATY